MVDKPQDEGAMFFQGMEFNPTNDLKQSELNRIVVHLFRRFFHTREGEPLPVKEHDKTMLTLIQFLMDVGFRLDEEAFADMPEELRRHFIVINRDNTKWRYGTRPRF